MELLLLVLRLVHVVGGILWVGFAVFVPFYLAPAIAEVGPDGGKVMAALQRRSGVGRQRQESRRGFISIARGTLPPLLLEEQVPGQHFQAIFALSRRADDYKLIVILSL